MEKISKVKKMVLTSTFIALCVVVPYAFHVVPNAGAVFCPMHIPVLLCGLILGWPYGLLCGLVGPVLSSALTAMPPVAMLPAMMLECATYGLIAGFLHEHIHTKWRYVDLYASLIPAMLCGRVVAGLAKAFIFARGTYSFGAWVTASFVTALPGIIVHLCLIPIVVLALTKARVIPLRKREGV